MPPNILVLLADEHSASALGCYGSNVVQTPALDALAQQGVLFESAYCNAPVCVPSRLSFMSGLYGWRVGAWSNMSEPPTFRPSIASMLSERGYRTAAIGKMHFVGPERHWGFQERPYGDLLGLSHQPDPIASAPAHQLHPGGPAEVPEEEMQETIVTRLGIEFLREHPREQPFCLWLAYNKPHFPLRPPRRYWERYYPDLADLPLLPAEHPLELHPWMRHHQRFYGVDKLAEEITRRGRAGYYGCVSFVDDQVAQVLDAVDELGLREDTLVVYFSDHGEMFGEHGLWRKSTFYEQAQRVPLIVRFPDGSAAGTRIGDVVELVDLFPTLAEVAGAAPPADLDGRSLLPLVRGERRSTRRGYAISEYYSHSVPGPMRMVRAGNWKLCMHLDARPSLFDLADDPEEFVDLAGDGRVARAVAADLEALLRQDWDERLVRESFVYAPSLSYLQVHTVHRSPNQYALADGELVDAETFYEGVDWASWSLVRTE